MKKNHMKYHMMLVLKVITISWNRTNLTSDTSTWVSIQTQQSVLLIMVKWNRCNQKNQAPDRTLPFSEALENTKSAEVSISEAKSNHLPAIMHSWASMHKLVTCGSATWAAIHKISTKMKQIHHVKVITKFQIKICLNKLQFPLLFHVNEYQINSKWLQWFWRTVCCN